MRRLCKKLEQGEVIQLGRHRLMCGDSSNPEDLEKLLTDTNKKETEDIDLILTDPPYLISYQSNCT